MRINLGELWHGLLELRARGCLDKLPLENPLVVQRQTSLQGHSVRILVVLRFLYVV